MFVVIVEYVDSYGNQKSYVMGPFDDRFHMMEWIDHEQKDFPDNNYKMRFMSRPFVNVNYKD